MKTPHYVYSLVYDEVPVYIGCSQSPYERTQQHVLKRRLDPLRLRLEIMARCPTKLEGLLMESRLILRLQPLWNIAGKKISTRRKVSSVWRHYPSVLHSARGTTMRTKLIVAAILLSGVYGLLTAIAVGFGL